jgi:hypothetical protein
MIPRHKIIPPRHQQNLAHETWHVSSRSVTDIVRARPRKLDLLESGLSRPCLASERMAASWSDDVTKMFRRSAARQSVGDGPIRLMPGRHSPSSSCTRQGYTYLAALRCGMWHSDHTQTCGCKSDVCAPDSPQVCTLDLRRHRPNCTLSG